MERFSASLESRDRRMFVALTLEFAMTHEEKTTGLSGRANLGEQEGMLFAPLAGGSFWGPTMRFDLDLVQIGNDGTILAVSTIVADTTTRHPVLPAAVAALEVRAGSMQTWGLGPGDLFIFPPEWELPTDQTIDVEETAEP